jgi:hypothetical protein
LRERYNRSFANRSPRLTQIKDSVYAATRVPALNWAWEAAARLGLRSMYRGINEVPSDVVIPKPRAETLAQLRHRFEPEVRELESLLGRSLDGWQMGRESPVEAVA